MHVFFIPSWYPHDGEPTSGIFQRDQALALADLRPGWTVTVLDWGQGELTVPLAVPRLWPQVARRLLHHRPAVVRRLAPNLVERRIPVVTWSPRVRQGRVGAILAAARVALAEAERESGRVDVVHAHVAFPAGYVAQALGRPYVVTEHMGPFPFPHFLRDGALAPEIAEPLRQARVRMAVSTALARAMEGFGVGTTAVVPNLVDERFFTPGPDVPSVPTFFFLGRLEAEKGLPELLSAASRLDMPFDLRVGGAGRQLEAPAGLPVTWLGPLSRARVREELQRATAVVLPSRHESFGVVLAEALACGTPIVATACGGPEDIVTDENGVLVPVGDVPALARALAEVARRDYDAEQIRAGFLARFSRAAVVEAVDCHYRAAL